jgi:hypothetical protein
VVFVTIELQWVQFLFFFDKLCQWSMPHHAPTAPHHLVSLVVQAAGLMFMHGVITSS